MPVFVLALTNPAFYLAAIMKTVTLGQQAGATNARSAGRELVGSTLMGACHGDSGLVRSLAAAELVDADVMDWWPQRSGPAPGSSGSSPHRFPHRSGSTR